MSFQVKNSCYPTQLSAAQAIASENIGSVYQTQNGLLSLNVQSINENQITYSTLDQNGVTGSLVTPLNIQPCQLLGVSDAVYYSGLLIGLWISVYSIVFLIRQIRGEMKDDT